MDLPHLGGGDVPAVGSHDAPAAPVYVHHDAVGLGEVLVEDLHEHHDHEVLGGVVVVEEDHQVLVRMLEFLFFLYGHAAFVPRVFVHSIPPD